MSAPAHQPDDIDDATPEPRSALRRLLRRGPSLEERLARIVDLHRRDLTAQRARFERTIEDLERRERLLSDAKASVERLLRLGARDLDAREADVARLIAELGEREERLRAEEEELAQRRSETGAVELRRVRVGQREQALKAREEALEARERALDERERTLAQREAGVAQREEALPALADEPTAARTEPAAPRLALVPGAAYRLVELPDPPPLSGRTLLVDDVPYDVLRVGRSPLPGDPRRCAYLVRGPVEREAPGGSL